MQKNLYRELYPTANSGSCDIYIPFIERVYDLCNDDGRVGIITSRQFMTTDYGETLRESIPTDCGISDIVDFTCYSPFEDITIYTSILLGQRQNNSTVRCICVRSREALEQVKHGGLESPERGNHLTEFELPLSSLGKDRWLVLSEEEKEARRKISSKSDRVLGELTEIGSPLKTGRDRIVKGTIEHENNDFLEISTNEFTRKVEAGAWKRLIVSEDIRRWRAEIPEVAVFFPYTQTEGEYEPISEQEFESEFTETYDALKPYKEDLLDRKDSGMTWRGHGRAWYSLARKGTPEYVDNNKIVTGAVVNAPEFCLDSSGYLIATGAGGARVITTSEIDEYYALGYLNSSCVYAYFKPISPPKQNGYTSIDIDVLNELPYVPLSVDEELAFEIGGRLRDSEVQNLRSDFFGK